MSDHKQRVLIVFGTRPEAIKLAPVIRALQSRPDAFLTRTCATAQHREMLDQGLAVFGIVPDIDLDLMQPEQTLSALGARVLGAMDAILAAERPDWVLVQGDTTTVMMAALAAQHRQVKVGHVEAGLRTHDRRNPFPEACTEQSRSEMNRVVTDHVSDLCFAPTETARAHLLAEGIPAPRIVVTGNTVIDALLAVASQPLPVEMVELLEGLGIGGKMGKQGAPGRQVDKETRRQGDKEKLSPSPSLPLSLSPPLPFSPSHSGHRPSSGELRRAAGGHLPGAAPVEPGAGRPGAHHLPRAPQPERLGAGASRPGRPARHHPPAAGGLPLAGLPDAAL